MSKNKQTNKKTLITGFCFLSGFLDYCPINDPPI